MFSAAFPFHPLSSTSGFCPEERWLQDIAEQTQRADKGLASSPGANTAPALQRSLRSLLPPFPIPAPRWPLAPATCQLQRDNVLPPDPSQPVLPCSPHSSARICSCPAGARGTLAPCPLLSPCTDPVPSLSVPATPCQSHVHGLAVPTTVPDLLLSPRTLPRCPPVPEPSRTRLSPVPPHRG